MPKAYSNGEGGRGIEGGRGKIAPHFFPNLQFFPYQNDSLNPAPWPPPHAHTSWHTIPCWAIQSKYLCDLGQGKVFVSIKKETKTLSVVPAPWQIYPNSTVYKLFQGNDEQSDIRRNDLGSVRNSTFPSNTSPLVSWELEFGVEGWSIKTVKHSIFKGLKQITEKKMILNRKLGKVYEQAINREGSLNS